MPTLPPGAACGSSAEIELGYDEATDAARLNAAWTARSARSAWRVSRYATPTPSTTRCRTETFDLKVGTIILATGHQFFDPARLPQYHYGRVANILDSTDLERMCSASGPTGGEILTADERMPESIVFIDCVGSRDAHTLLTARDWLHARDEAGAPGPAAHDPRGGEPVVHRHPAPGKGYEEFYEQVQQEGVIFVPRPARPR